ncbi:hypothetical protein [Sphingobacterium wenxiniae]|uniref:Predicted 3-hydroxylacyl-ACP dehydratase, HotDog domain n=1 Tax=Sphingobacterium wenxiniae TaxID=683125 RepID=A0A1I6S2X0_9SPHI|nr:hypothetical protein [Sphingobacterium wenxiniae]SFS71078.1 Predicted 3-hydroxylacyl-ACP dehydratase, HotDog domain [Sphingobacterium wenxiniae]
MDKELHKIAIEHYLPHRPPMLMVDAILEISPTQVLCSFIIKEDNIFLIDGLFQEVGLMENMAQTCSSIVGQTFYEADYNPLSDKRIIGFISGVKQLTIYNLPKVGDEILTSSTLTSQFDGEGYSICTMNVQTKRGEDVLSSAEINLFLKKQ